MIDIMPHACYSGNSQGWSQLVQALALHLRFGGFWASTGVNGVGPSRGRSHSNFAQGVRPVFASGLLCGCCRKLPKVFDTNPETLNARGNKNQLKPPAFSAEYMGGT